jgi:hypothetical protein
MLVGVLGIIVDIGVMIILVQVVAVVDLQQNFNNKNNIKHILKWQ